MMDTVLNLGLNDETVKSSRATSGDERFAYDSYRRFIQMYSNVVLDVDSHNFEEIIEALQGSRAATRSTPTSRPTTGAQVIADYKTQGRGGDRQAVPAGARTSSSGARSARCSAPG